MFDQMYLLLASLFSSKPSSTPSNVTMLEHNIIPEEVQPIGPMWSSLPMEIIMEIVIYAMMAQPLYNNSKAIDKKRFDIINNFRPFTKDRLTWPWPRTTFMKALYSGNEFVFKVNCPINRLSLPPALPPFACRGYLRRIQIHIGLKDQYNVIMPGDYSATTKIIRSVTDLFLYSPGARILRDLNGTLGFVNLEVLDLHIFSHFTHGDFIALDIIEKAGFVVRARNVSITEDCWDEFPYPGVAGLIAVEMVV
jgi:hypothetical protein